MDKILKAKCLCYNTELAEMGVDTEEWFDFAIYLRHVIAVKATETENNQPCTSLFLADGSSFVVDLTFDEVFELWTKELQT